MKILVVNCGSSSLKYEIYEMPSQQSLGKGLVERIGLPSGNLTQEYGSRVLHREQEIPNHRVAFEMMMEAILDKEQGILKSVSEIAGVGTGWCTGESSMPLPC